ncbi:GT4 family glycosyltransferase PelF [Pectinatus cerevisiiphilus]|uniref:Glycosyltransferase involved in cell wall biosynthesis n=1 Tax=Pectinatus cerevisiiphilus TaxID=86956 RepID=A0A4R3K293_9FIRM|nr:GT4 family glycosyltransferase PelF [Pectinatus cerevisiiphilus]TCS76225.1 glycosyltransferase involved in cell wall biosynthesis [Pectinatus cerevisiiphilus]
MKICILAEGSYPYVVGGVSSWIHMLVQGMPEHQFIIYSVGAERKDKGKFKYTFPDNIIKIQEVFLDDILNLQPPTKIRAKLTAKQKESLAELLSGTAKFDFNMLLTMFRQVKKQYTFIEIFMCPDFYDVVMQVYKKNFPYLSFTDYFWTIRSMLLPLFYLLQEDYPKADLYHSVAAGYCGVIGAMASLIEKKPFLLTEHGIYSREREEEILKCSWAEGDFKKVWIKYFYALSYLSYEYADVVTTLSANNRQVELELGCAAQKIKIIPNGVKIEQFAKITSDYNNATHPFTIGAVLRIVPIKDIITMLRSFYILQQSIPDARLLIMGNYEEDPEYFISCKNLVKALNLHNVEFTGAIDILTRLNEVDVLALSSISEGLPLAVLEGMAAKKPFVSTDVGCCRELLYGNHDDDLGKAGMIVAVMDFQAMAKSFLRLAKDPSLRYHMGEIGYERVKRYYMYEDFITRFKNLYGNYNNRR